MKDRIVDTKALKYISKNCFQCGKAFECGSNNGNGKCWCAEFPILQSADLNQDCFCPDCLKDRISKQQNSEEAK